MNLAMKIKLIGGTDPEWTGTLDEFWSANYFDIPVEEIRVIHDTLNRDGVYAYGGGAAPDFLIRKL